MQAAYPILEFDTTRQAIIEPAQVLQADNAPYVPGKTWTTDDSYRETPAKVALRRGRGLHHRRGGSGGAAVGKPAWMISSPKRSN